MNSRGEVSILVNELDACYFFHVRFDLKCFYLSITAGLSNVVGGHAKFIRIDGSTSPKSRQEQILTFQTDPTVRIALLGITAAGVAVTLTASSTVWFAELFWTPAIMVQAEDRCHRIGQQASVRCLYFVAKGTLDEVLWKLIEKKFRDLGEVSRQAMYRFICP
jgi:SNF2 family DNA or RNA helicase